MRRTPDALPPPARSIVPIEQHRRRNFVPRKIHIGGEFTFARMQRPNAPSESALERGGRPLFRGTIQGEFL
jgi:hypothetical protein